MIFLIMNTLLILLLIPFMPIWMLGGVFSSENFIAGKTNQATEEISNKKESVQENCDRFENADNGEKSAGSNEFNLLPIDTVYASGFIPVREANARDLKIWAGSSVAIDVGSGTILHYDNGRKRTQIASLTKMMTAILAMENIKDLNEEVVITKEALDVSGTIVGCPTSVFCNGNRMYEGEKVKVIDLMKAMLMNSANDAATILGIQIAGSSDKFVQMMNDETKKLGLKDTHFCTPSGLEIDGQEDQCYSSAYDIARVAAYSLQYDTIWNIMRISEDRFYSTDGKYMHELKNTDQLLNNLPNCIGGKTGFTPMAGKSLLLGATDPSGKHKIIAVVLNDETRWEDMKTLIDWVFENYKWK